MCHPLRRTTAAAGETAAAMTARAVEELTAPCEEGGISEMLNAIKEQNDRIIERLSTAQEEDLQTQRMKLVPQKTERALHRTVQTLDQTWDLGKPFTAPENKVINTEIIKQMRATDKVTPVFILTKSMKTYYNTKVREQKRKQAGVQSQTLVKQRRLQRRHEVGINCFQIH